MAQFYNLWYARASFLQNNNGSNIFKKEEP
jgi:hypothetical protein